MPVNPLERQKNLQKANPPVEQKNAYQDLYGLREIPSLQWRYFRRTSTIRAAMARSTTLNSARKKKSNSSRCSSARQRRSSHAIGIYPSRPTSRRARQWQVRFSAPNHATNDGQDWEGEWVTNADDPNLFCLGVHVLPEPKKQKRIWEFSVWSSRPCPIKLFAEIDKQLRAAMIINLLTEEQMTELGSLPVEELNQSLSDVQGFSNLLTKYDITFSGFVDLVKLPGKNSTWRKSLFATNFLENNCSLTAIWADWVNKGIAGNDYKWRKEGVEWLTNGIVPVMLVAGYRRLIILLDEFEKIYISQNARERDEFLDGLRQYFF